MMVFIINWAGTSQDVYVLESIECDLSTTPRYVTLAMYLSILQQIQQRIKSNAEKNKEEQ